MVWVEVTWEDDRSIKDVTKVVEDYFRASFEPLDIIRDGVICGNLDICHPPLEEKFDGIRVVAETPF